MFRKFAITALGAATLLTAPLPALAMPLGSGMPVVKTEAVQLVDHRYNRRNRYNRRKRYYRRSDRHYRHRHQHHNNGAAVVAGIIGLGAVLAITNSNRHYGNAHVYSYQSGSPEWKAACDRKYRSFEWHTGLYTTYSGYKRRCRLP